MKTLFVFGPVGLRAAGCELATHQGPKTSNQSGALLPLQTFFDFFPADFFPSLPQVSSTHNIRAPTKTFASPSAHPARHIRSSLTEKT